MQCHLGGLDRVGVRGRQDVPESHAQGEKVLQRDGATSRHRVGQIGPHMPQYPPAGQLGQPAIHRFVEAQDAPLDQHQSTHGGDRFGQRGNAKDVVPLHGVALLERLGPHHVDPHLAPAGDQGNVPRHGAVLHMSSQAIVQCPQTFLAERFTAHDSRRSSPAGTALWPLSVRPVIEAELISLGIQHDGPTGSIALVVGDLRGAKSNQAGDLDPWFPGRWSMTLRPRSWTGVVWRSIRRHSLTGIITLRRSKRTWGEMT
jgi:hypothetical protein